MMLNHLMPFNPVCRLHHHHHHHHHHRVYYIKSIGALHCHSLRSCWVCVHHCHTIHPHHLSIFLLAFVFSTIPNATCFSNLSSGILHYMTEEIQLLLHDLLSYVPCNTTRGHYFLISNLLLTSYVQNSSWNISSGTLSVFPRLSSSMSKCLLYVLRHSSHTFSTQFGIDTYASALPRCAESCHCSWCFPNSSSTVLAAVTDPLWNGNI